MKESKPSPETIALFETASMWQVRRSDAGWTQADEQAFQAWLQAHPSHRQAFERVAGTWKRAESLSVPPSGARRAAAKPLARRSSMGWRWGGALSFCVLLAAGAWLWRDFTPRYSQRLHTAHHETTSLRLPDGSNVTVNRDTDMTINYYPRRREVVFKEGEAFFQVEATGQPFTVKLAQGEVAVRGTAFNVRAVAGRFFVGVQHGMVDVIREGGGDPIRLRANEIVAVQPGAGQIRQGSLSSEGIGSWRLGQLVFQDTPLIDVIQELSRYRDRPIRLRDQRLARRGISGLAKTSDPDAFLESLAELLGAPVLRVSDGSIVIG